MPLRTFCCGNPLERIVAYSETDAVWMDLADVHANVDQGCHIASMGGTWMAMVYGIAGMREQNGRISLKPCLGKRIEACGSISSFKGSF